MTEKKNPHFSDTLEKGLRILQIFAQDKQGYSLTELSRAIGVNKTTVYRFVNTYCELGYLRRDPLSKHLELGPRSIALAHSFLQSSVSFDVIKPLVDEVHEKYQVHVDVALLQGDAMFVIYRREAKDTLTFRHFTLSKGLHYLATGKAALAFMPQEERLRIIEDLDLERKTPRTIADKESLLIDLEETFQRGYSINDEEFIPGLLAIGAPLISLKTSRVVGALSFDTSTAQHTLDSFQEKFAPVLIDLARKVSTMLPEV